ncbi:hypothetical protein [Desulfovibrio desulfuricans]|uniref:hypothetical protein n=1 Tax=Desulfovibrio desulfuricans TaxID=876 RepID=UPI001AE873FC|nr:hypothetical protein [Desulfovibrio desulfuricans]QTO39215.1 hypothetical protein J8J02_08625 [Desulfovibrio desulfuricans]
MVTHEQIDFLENRHASKHFMPALGTKITTLHGWGARGFINLPKGGTGRSLYLRGMDIVYARCLVVLSNAGCAPKSIALRGLYQNIEFFVQGCRDSYTEHEKMPTTYALYRYVERCEGKNSCIDGEWSLSFEGMSLDARHITEAHGHKAAPFWAILNLTDIMQEMSKKVWAAY